MSSNVFEVLKERGFLYQTTDEQALAELLGNKKITCYVGFDATAESLHVGHLVPIMALAHMQKHGHRPIALLGGGTTLVGDPSGKTEMRQMLTLEKIKEYGEGIKRQFEKYIDFSGEKALMLNNADWLVPLNYIEFLRDIGRHFSINRMLTAESVKLRLETGLSFIEFNYMLLQSYDFYVLARDYDCIIQMGGQDQWGNIVSGIDLTRRMLGRQVYGMTFPLIMTAGGEKLGKSAGNAVWLDAAKTPVFEYYQYWRNLEDADIKKCLSFFTFLPVEEASRLPEENINRAKEILAFEATRITHGKEEAVKAYTAAARQFGSADPDNQVRTSSDIRDVRLDLSGSVPVVQLSRGELENGYWIVKCLVDSGLCASNSEARRLIKQGGASLGDEKIQDDTFKLTEKHMTDGKVLLKAGKKRIRQIEFV